ncbi:hypothetical protein NGRA_3473 [Nosema granulosis]|uniref:Retrotransposon gag domain-containing protein n=1 Tax=Nosema granulosis TaxID=83296 RepID=A0A9P6GUP9_9MICR|nr:hypothetical protein NGRA_3473 [Nosema granulosis]
MIDDIRYIDIIRWCKDFDDLISLIKWNKDIQTAVLRQLNKDGNLLKDELCDNWKDIKQQLIQKVYLIHEERLYKKKLQNIFQNSYCTIQEYYESIKENIKILQTMTKMKDVDVNVLFRETFFNGLGR